MPQINSTCSEGGEIPILVRLVGSCTVRAGKALLFIKSSNSFLSQIRWSLRPRDPKKFV